MTQEIYQQGKWIAEGDEIESRMIYFYDGAIND